MLLNASNFLGIISLYRLIWIGGRFGGHKTSLAYQMATKFLERGYRLVSNNRSIWSDDLEEVSLDENGHLKAVVILDEGGVEFKASRQIEEIAAYAAKMDVIYIIPSFWPPVRSAQVVTAQPLFSFKAAGVPLVVYKWRVKINAFQDSGYFAWFLPGEIYGIYSRQDPGARTDQIVQFLIQRKDEFRKRFGHTDSLSAVEEITEQELLMDAALTMAEAADSMQAIPIRKRRRRR